VLKNTTVPPFFYQNFNFVNKRQSITYVQKNSFGIIFVCLAVNPPAWLGKKMKNQEL